MTGHRFRGDDVDQARKPRSFDPIVAGKEFGLTPTLSLEIWARVCREACGYDGEVDEERAQQRFRDLAKQATHRRLLGPDPGRLTRYEAEVPGVYPEHGAFAAPVPGRDTEVRLHERRWAQRTGGTEAMTADSAPPRLGEVDAPAELTRPLGRTLSGVAPQDPLDSNRGAHALEAARRAEAEAIDSAASAKGQRPSGPRITIQTLFGRAERSDSALTAAVAPSVQPTSPVPAVRSSNPLFDVDLLHVNVASRSSATGPMTALTKDRGAGTLYRQAIDANEVYADDPAIENALARIGGGQAVASELRRELELELGVSLTGARVHTDSVAAAAARSVRAEAFTVGEDIYFAQGAFAPDTGHGRKLLAHEMAHVAQALRGRVAPAGNELRVSQPGEALEQEAEAVAERLHGADATAHSGSPSHVGSLAGPRSSGAIRGDVATDAVLGARSRHVLFRSPAATGDADAMWQQMFSGASVEASQLGRVQAPLGIYLKASPVPSAPRVSPLIGFDTNVYILRSTPQLDVAKRWAYVTVIGGGGAGFVEERYLALGAPEPTAKLHRVNRGERLGTIAAGAFGSAITGGNDARLYVQAIYEANKGRAGIRLDSVNLTLSERLPREQQEEETLEIYKGVKVIEGQAIWISSREFVQHLRASGLITSGASDLSKLARAGKDYASDVVDFAKFNAGYVAGIFQGAYEAIRDIFKSAVDLLRMAFEFLKAYITGHLLELAIEAAKKLKEFVAHIPDVAEALGTYVAERWTSAGPFGKGQFVGEVVGYITANVLLVLATGGGAVAVLLARAAESGSQIARAVMLLVKVADAAANPLKLLEGAGKGAAISEETAAKLKQALVRDGAAVNTVEHEVKNAEREATGAHVGGRGSSTTVGSANRGKQGPEIKSGVSEAPDPLLRGGQLDERQIDLDKRLVSAVDKMIVIGKREVTATDLAALTKASGVEHAIVILHDDTRALVRMESYAGGMLPANTKRLLMHSHPDDWGSGMAKFISAADIEAIITLKQEYSYMVTLDGTVYKFTTQTMPMSIGEVVRKLHPIHGWMGKR